LVSTDFTVKTDMLLRYVEETYLSGALDDESIDMIRKMQESDQHRPSDKKVVEYGFDAIFLSNGDKSNDDDDGRQKMPEK
jgi:hypothetical protein